VLHILCLEQRNVLFYRFLCLVLHLMSLFWMYNRSFTVGQESNFNSTPFFVRDDFMSGVQKASLLVHIAIFAFVAEET
jgi:hypothetical protein